MSLTLYDQHQPHPFYPKVFFDRQGNAEGVHSCITPSLLSRLLLLEHRGIVKGSDTFCHSLWSGRLCAHNYNLHSF